MNSEDQTGLRRFLPKEPIDWILLGWHLLIIIYVTVCELFHIEKTSGALAFIIITISIVWTASIIRFIKKLTDRIDKDLSQKQLQIDTANAAFETSKASYLVTLEKLIKKSNYADALLPVNNAFGEIHNVMREISARGGQDKLLSVKVEDLDKSSLQNYSNELAYCINKIDDGLGKFCNHTEEAFRILTGAGSVAVCIKICSGNDPNNLKSWNAETIVRGNASNYKRKQKPQHKADGTILTHGLMEKENTSFSTIVNSIINKSPKPFFCNSLPLLWPYNNSSFYNVLYNDGKPPEKRPNMNWPEAEVIAAWTLPYKATIVLPILPDHLNDQSIEMLKGFFCIDTDEMNTFNKEYDPVLLAGLVDGCYNKVNLLLKLLYKMEESEKALNSLK